MLVHTPFMELLVHFMYDIINAIPQSQACSAQFYMTGIPVLFQPVLDDIQVSILTQVITIKYHYGVNFGEFTGKLVDPTRIEGTWKELPTYTTGEGFFNVRDKLLEGEWGGTGLLSKAALGFQNKKGNWSILFST